MITEIVVETVSSLKISETSFTNHSTLLKLIEFNVETMVFQQHPDHPPTPPPANPDLQSRSCAATVAGWRGSDTGS